MLSRINSLRISVKLSLVYGIMMAVLILLPVPVRQWDCIIPNIIRWRGSCPLAFAMC